MNELACLSLVMAVCVAIYSKVSPETKWIYAIYAAAVVVSYMIYKLH